MGFPFDVCVRLRMPPCTLDTPPTDVAHLFFKKQKNPNEFLVYNSSDEVLVFVAVDQSGLMVLEVTTRVTQCRARLDGTMLWVVQPCSEMRTTWWDDGTFGNFVEHAIGYYTFSTPEPNKTIGPRVETTQDYWCVR